MHSSYKKSSCLAGEPPARRRLEGMYDLQIRLQGHAGQRARQNGGMLLVPTLLTRGRHNTYHKDVVMREMRNFWQIHDDRVHMYNFLVD